VNRPGGKFAAIESQRRFAAHEVRRLKRRASTFNTARIHHLYVDSHDPTAKLCLHCQGLGDGARLAILMAEIEFDGVDDLTVQSHSHVSFDEPDHTADTIITAVIQSSIRCNSRPR
jgi:GDPmannose 4,6-dehydratase